MLSAHSDFSAHVFQFIRSGTESFLGQMCHKNEKKRN